MFPRPALASHIVVYVTESFNVAWILFHVSVQILIFTKIDFVILGWGLVFCWINVIWFMLDSVFHNNVIAKMMDVFIKTQTYSWKKKSSTSSINIIKNLSI